jgi:hypothetical protein
VEIGYIKVTKTLRKKFYITLKKASVPLKMNLKTLEIFEKASIYLEKSSKTNEIFIKAPHF